ncbi:MAG TPA: 4-hydroxy-3-methylbut-2-enyl diphosphate reductase [Candidatus Hydrogenedentes bacterium]|nr:4-hydroxy-3-methylbut-2-enyl diphosphate reductase [Candidatus Hydrogenedentota bacterium]
MRIIVAKPRGFCAGVERAIKSVETALERFGPPVYVLNHIVHNAHVVNELREKGAVFVRNLNEVPHGAHLLFSAHGVGPDRWEQAQDLRLQVIDATCPLVEKVHHEARRFALKNHTIILIGEKGHDETVGTMGWAPENIRIIQRKEDVASLEVSDPSKLAYITQTTLSVEDCQEIIEALQKRFPEIQGPPKADICYATSNRQAAVKALAQEVDLVLVVGDPESANSTRLAEVARSKGKPAYLIPDASAIHLEWLNGVNTLLLTSGASVPEKHVQGVLAFLNSLASCAVEEYELVHEDVHFRLPRNIGGDERP